MKKVYYPLHPCKGKVYRKPKNVTYLYIEADADSNFTGAAATDGADFLIYLEKPDEVAKYITTLPDKAWIITYYIDNWRSITDALINTFHYIGGIGKENHVLELTFGEIGFTVVDALQFLVCDLSEAIEDLTDYQYNDEASPVELVYMLSKVWAVIVDTLKREYYCYPAKTPGATALKIWRRFLAEDVFARGKNTSRISKAALRQPALHWAPGIYEQAYMYDISASYPSVMSNIRYPLFTKTFTGKPQDGLRWIATVIINYKCNGKFAPLAVALEDGTNVNPVELHNTRVTITYIDALTLEYTGQFEILEWIEGICWAPEDERDFFSEWARSIERASQDARTKKVLKIVSRSLHSKFSQRPYYEHIEIVRVEMDVFDKLVKSNSGKVLEMYPLDNGELAIKLLTRKRTGFKPFNRPDWEALTLAAARFRMYASIDENTVYVHTDSIISTEPREDLPIGSAFGLWKEKEHGQAVIAGIGLYTIGSEVGKCGMKIDDWRAREAIARAVEESNTIVETLFHPSLFSSVGSGKTKFTVKAQNYPHAIIKGAAAFVTRSPTRLIMVKYVRRWMTTKGNERWIQEYNKTT